MYMGTNRVYLIAHEPYGKRNIHLSQPGLGVKQEANATAQKVEFLKKILKKALSIG